MKQTTISTMLVVGLALAGAPAMAADPKPAAAPAAPAGASAPPAGAMDMSKVGPMSRPVTKEDKKGVDALYKAMEDAWKKGDADAVAENVDFPVIMMSDDSSGKVQHFEASRDQWIGMMKPMLANMPKDAKMTHKHTPYFLSDDLAISIEEISMTMGKTKGKWKAMSVLTLRDGKWKVKQMTEAGWGDMKPPTTAAMPHAPAPAAPAAAAKK
jgi:uncharacterized protein (TIGR02246 family)